MLCVRVVTRRGIGVRHELFHWTTDSSGQQEEEVVPMQSRLCLPFVLCVPVIRADPEDPSYRVVPCPHYDLFHQELRAVRLDPSVPLFREDRTLPAVTRTKERLAVSNWRAEEVIKASLVVIPESPEVRCLLSIQVRLFLLRVRLVLQDPVMQASSSCCRERGIRYAPGRRSVCVREWRQS